MLRSALRSDVPYAVVTTTNYRPGERPHRGDVRPAWVLDNPYSPRRLAPRTPAAVAYLRADADIPVTTFLASATPSYLGTILGSTLLAHRSDEARRADFRRLDERTAENHDRAVEVYRSEDPDLAERLSRRRPLCRLDIYEEHKALVDACEFTRRPLYAILSTWDRYLEAQVSAAAMELLLADSATDDPEVEPDSLRAVRLFADHGVVIDPSRTFAQELLVTYDELFAAFGQYEGRDEEA